jgi:hypothetical protein
MIAEESIDRNRKDNIKIEDTLEERGKQYGKFSSLSALSQTLKREIRETECFDSMMHYQVESLEMIIHKIARICNGDPDYVDSWRDIAGYATLVVKYLEEKE